MSVPSRSEPSGSSNLRPESNGGIGHAQLARLLRLVMILQSERFPIARTLATECEVSRRTVYRDLEVLEEAGIQREPVDEAFIAPLLAAVSSRMGEASFMIAQAQGRAIAYETVIAEIRHWLVAAPMTSGAPHPGDRSSLRPA